MGNYSFVMQKAKQKTIPYTIGIITHMPYCRRDYKHIFVRIKWSLTTGEKGTLPTSAHVQMPPCFWSLSNWQMTVKYILHYPSPLRKR